MFEFHVQIKRDIRAIGPRASVKWTLEDLIDHIRSPSDLLLALLRPDGAPLLLRILQLLHLLDQDLIAIGVLLDLGYHDLIKQVDLPELLVIAVLLIVLRIDWMER